MFAEGDSWFNYFPKANPVFSESDLVTEISDHCDVYSFAKYGDMIRNMASTTNMNLIRLNVNFICGNGGLAPIQFFMLSGGGNDLLDTTIADNYLEKILQPGQVGNPASYINPVALDVCMNDLSGFYVTFISGIRARLGIPSLPFVLHTYDFPIPDGRRYHSGPISAGPWLYPALAAPHIGVTDIPQGYEIIKLIATAFKNMLLALVSTVPNVHLVDLQGTLGNSPNSSLWENEIHPTVEGFDRLGTVYYNAVRSTSLL